jgi:hypothetical protein
VVWPRRKFDYQSSKYSIKSGGILFLRRVKVEDVTDTLN